MRLTVIRGVLAVLAAVAVVGGAVSCSSVVDGAGHVNPAASPVATAPVSSAPATSDVPVTTDAPVTSDVPVTSDAPVSSSAPVTSAPPTPVSTSATASSTSSGRDQSAKYLPLLRAMDNIADDPPVGVTHYNGSGDVDPKGRFVVDMRSGGNTFCASDSKAKVSVGVAPGTGQQYVFTVYTAANCAHALGAITVSASGDVTYSNNDPTLPAVAGEIGLIGS